MKFLISSMFFLMAGYVLNFYIFITMSLVYGASSISASDISSDVYFVGVGPYLRIYKSDEILFEYLIFPINHRIKNIVSQKENVLLFSENKLKILKFDQNFQKFEIIREDEFHDNILSAKFVNGSLIIILCHGQICKKNEQNSFEISNPSVWKIVTSAFIINETTFIFGDSLGNLTYLYDNNSSERALDYGTIFCIDYKEETKEILTANEYRTCALLKLSDDNNIIPVWSVQDHPSRVWGCKFLPIGPISYGEDGCIHLHIEKDQEIPQDSEVRKRKIVISKEFHLHRTKNITAFASINGNEVITGGQNALLRRFTLYNNIPEVNKYQFCENNDKKSKNPMTPFSLTILRNNEIFVGTFGGSVISLPNFKEILKGEQYGAWYLMESYDNIIFAASRNHFHFVYNAETQSDNIFSFPQKCSAISLAISKNYLVSIYSDNSLKIYDMNSKEILQISLSNYLKKPPIALCIHPVRPIICFGSHSSRVVVLVFSEGFKELLNSFIFQSASLDGFRGLSFCDDLIYCAGRTDGIISILGECENKWMLKSSWRIASQCRATIGLDTIKTVNEDHHSRAIVSVITKEGIAIWDIETQTMIAQHELHGQNDKLIVKFVNDRNYSLVWTDKSTVYSQINYSSIIAYSIGVSFHGLRGLCMTKLNLLNSDHKLIATGGCDRDVKLWNVDNAGKLTCVETLQAVDSGTHAIGFYEKESLLFAGGSKEYLYVWKLVNDKLYRLNIFRVGNNYKFYQLRVTSLVVTNDLKLFIGMSDASIRVYKYHYNLNNLVEGNNEKCNELEFIEKIEVNGVPLTSCYSDGIPCFATSNGYAYWFAEKCLSQKLTTCGIHCIRTFPYKNMLVSVTSTDDGNVKIWNLDFNGGYASEIISIDHGHICGTKALAVETKENILRLLTFSYDQKAIYYEINLDSLEILKTMEFSTTVPDGEACEFFKEGFIVFGFAIQFIPLTSNI